MRLKPYAPTPNAMIESSLTPNAKRIYTALLLAAKPDGTVKNATVRSLAHACSLHTETVCKRLRELETVGWVTRQRRYRYSLTLGRPVYDCITYKLKLPEGGYTLIPKTVLRKKVSGAAFAVMLHLYLRAGRDGRAYPSIRHLAETRKEQKTGGCGVSKASVCRALKLLEKLKFFIKLPCWTAQNHFSCNSYIITELVVRIRKALQQQSGPERNTNENVEGGGLKNRTHPLTNKITRNYILRKREKVSPIYCTLHKYLDRFAGFCAGIFNGIFRPRRKDIH